jgi:LPXTG-site transpeptidase (sortase) family protein
VSFFLCGVEVSKRYTRVQIIESISTTNNFDLNLSHYQINKIDIKSLQKTLPVEDMTNSKLSLEDKFRSTFEDKISLVKVGKNSILFGHNWPNLLGSLNKVKKGDLITLEALNTKSSFEVTGIFEVTPDQTHVLLSGSSTSEKLTLITCSGFLDSKRLVVVGKKLES